MELEFSDISEVATYHTAREIASQPKLWRATYEVIKSQEAGLAAFLKKVLSIDDLMIILTGAGTSAYVGDVLHKVFQRHTGKVTEAVATTDLIVCPKDYFDKDKATLLVSFARSGDSPESEAAVSLANKYSGVLFHLIITCNPDGKLASVGNSDNSYVLLMPPETNDKALAMTSSFTSMLLAGVLVSDLKNLDANKGHVEKLAVYGETILQQFHQKIKRVAKMDFNRVVFLGSGLLKGIARESQLKLQELTNGKVICKYDSFLGLRHGPLAVIDQSTIVVYLFSQDRYINQYEMDLVRSINASNQKLFEIGIGEFIEQKGEISLDLTIEPATEKSLPEEYFVVCSVLPAQLLGFYKSIDLGLSPDAPSSTNSINRVVQGVNIYPHH